MTRYPVMLIHGIGFRDNINYWGRIPAALKTMGVKVYLGGQDSHGDVKTNAEQIKISLEAALKDSGAEKINLIAHSKGGLDARYLITSLGMGDRVATLSTLATPHHGSRVVDILLKAPRWLISLVCACSDGFYGFLGDKKVDSARVYESLSTTFAADFNENNPDDDRVYYQSFAFAMSHAFSDMLMALPYLFVYCIEGKNDGLLAPRSAVWGHFQGTYTGPRGRGISHCDEVDLRRRAFGKERGGENEISDMADFYRALVFDLAQQGY